MTLRDLSLYRFEGKSEQAVREEWIFPLLLQLGYGPTTLDEVQFEESLMADLSCLKQSPDYFVG